MKKSALKRLKQSLMVPIFITFEFIAACGPDRLHFPTIKILKSRDIWETLLFCKESLYYDTWLRESLVRHHTKPYLLF